MRCKHCKTIFEPIRFNIKHCLGSEDCVKSWNNDRKEKLKIANKKSWNKEKKVRKAKMLTVQEYIKTVQMTFNKYIRLRDQGKVCISCQKPPKKVNAGHYYNANNHWNVRFDEDNVHSQCEACNTSLSGNLIEYREHLINKIGLCAYNSLNNRARFTRKFTIEELKEINEIYKYKIKQHEKHD